MTAIPESLIVFLIMALFFGAIALMVNVFRSGIDRRAAGLWRIEAKIDLLLNHMGANSIPIRRSRGRWLMPSGVVKRFKRSSLGVRSLGPA